MNKIKSSKKWGTFFISLVVPLTLIGCATTTTKTFEPGVVPVFIQTGDTKKAETRAMIGQYASEIDSEVIESGEHYARMKRLMSQLSGALDAAVGDIPFYVLKNEEMPNAFAINSTSIAVTTALLDKISDEELSVVVAHEMAHILGQHSEDDTEQKRGKAVGIGASILGDVVATETGVGVAGGVVEQGVYVAGMGAFVLSYGRAQEYEADHVGMLLMAKAGIDPQLALDFWARSEEILGEGQENTFLSSHPSHGAREDRLQETMQYAEPLYANADAYVYEPPVQQEQEVSTKNNSTVSTNTASEREIIQAQRYLKENGYEIGKVDGIFGKKTASAIKQYQRDTGLVETGVVDSETTASMGIRPLIYSKDIVIEVQQALSDQGYNTGKVDGFIGPRTTNALIAFQKDNGIDISGEITDETINLLRASEKDDEQATNPTTEIEKNTIDVTVERPIDSNTQSSNNTDQPTSNSPEEVVSDTVNGLKDEVSDLTNSAEIADDLTQITAADNISPCFPREGNCISATVNNQSITPVNADSKHFKHLKDISHYASDIRGHIIESISGPLNIQIQLSIESRHWYGDNPQFETQIIPLDNQQLKTSSQIGISNNIYIEGSSALQHEEVLDDGILPNGAYLLRIRVNGDSNWDRLTIYTQVNNDIKTAESDTSNKNPQRIEIPGTGISFIPPEQFQALSKEAIDLKWPSKRAPSYALGTSNTTTSIAYDIKDHHIPQSDIDKFREQLTKIFNNSVPKIQWLENKLIDHAGQKWVYLEFTGSAIDTHIHNIMLLTGYNEKMVEFNFNSTVEEFPLYEDQLKASINSITLPD